MNEYKYSSEYDVDIAHAIGFRAGVMAATESLRADIAALRSELDAKQRGYEDALDMAQGWRVKYSELYESQRSRFSTLPAKDPQCPE
jgi:hypothetical protein